MRNLILDSWPVMGWLRGQQPAADRTLALFKAAERGEYTLSINIVNLGEIFYLAAKGKDLAFGQRIVTDLRDRIKTISSSDDLVMLAAEMKAQHQISYADAFAVATALSLDWPLVTGDTELQSVAAHEPKLKLEWLGA